MGKVLETYPDNSVWYVRLKTKTGELDRPVTKICLLQEGREGLVKKSDPQKIEDSHSHFTSLAPSVMFWVIVGWCVLGVLDKIWVYLVYNQLAQISLM